MHACIQPTTLRVIHQGINSKLNSEGRNRIIRVEMPYVPLLEIVAHVPNAQTWNLDPAHKSYTWYKVPFTDCNCV